MTAWFLLEGRRMARSLRSGRSSALPAVLVLSLGIGATTAVFAIVETLVLRPFAYPDADRLVLVLERNPDGSPSFVSVPNYRDWAADRDAVEQMAAWSSVPMTLANEEGRERIIAGTVSGNFFSVLGARPLAGRLFRSADEGFPRAVVSAGFRDRWGGGPDVVGRSVTLDDRSVTIVGVLPGDFMAPYGEAWDFWVPLGFSGGETGRDVKSLFVVGRLAGAAGVANAQAEMDVVAENLAGAYPETNRGRGAVVRNLRDAAVERERPSLYALLAAVVFVLLIACANAGILFVADENARRGDSAVRMALGLSRTRLLLLVLAEHSAVVAVAGVTGAIVAAAAVGVFTPLAPVWMLRMTRVSVGGPELAFTVVTSFVCCVAAGLLPALRSSGVDLARWLPQSPGGRSVRRGPAGSASVVLGLGLSMLLLAHAHLALGHLASQWPAEPGFKVRDMFAGRIELRGARYDESPGRALAMRELLRLLTADASIGAAAFSTTIPFDGYHLAAFVGLQGGPDTELGESAATQYRASSPGFFDALEIPLRYGRGFRAGDDEGAPVAFVVNETLARRLGLENSETRGVGRPMWVRVRNPSGSLSGDVERRGTIVGVVADAKEAGPGSQPVAYVPMVQHPPRSFALLVSGTESSSALTRRVRGHLRNVDPALAFNELQPYERLIAGRFAAPRFYALLIGTFALTGLVLAVAGLYGLVTCWIDRNREGIVIRLALGATPGGITRWILARALFLCCLGLLWGTLGAVATTRFAGSLVGAAGGANAPGMGLAAVLTILAAAGASYAAARRALRRSVASRRM